MSEPGIPPTSESPVDAPPGWDAEEEVPMRDDPQGVDEWGTTARDQLQREPVALRRLREEPEWPRPGDGEGIVGGRLYEPGAEDGLYDAEPDAVGELDAVGDDTLSAEEAAVRVVDDPPGLSGSADPGYVED